jgi:hypothetical protein
MPTRPVLESSRLELFNYTHAAVPRLTKPTIVESRRDIPYGFRNLQKFAHFYVLSAHYIALLRAI